MNSSKNETAKLSDGWVLCSSKSNPGRKYYFNKKTGKSSWTQPQADEKTVPKQEASKQNALNQTKKKQEQSLKQTFKRKSDGAEQCSNKKIKQVFIILLFTETVPKPTKHESNKRQSTSNKKHSSNKQTNKHVKKETPKKTSTKNNANARLSQFRDRLSLEMQKDENEKSPVKRAQDTSENVTEIPAKPKVEPKPQSTSETKPATSQAQSQSPNSDSVQSIPSPSQFLAANKIISSMKAQLPEEYCNKVKQKDTFADIEQGISNQTPEYPQIKHPATPPQFYQASQIVSAMKSKLCKLSNDTNVQTTNLHTFMTAKDRMEALRTRLSEGVENNTEVTSSKEVEKCDVEAMDVDIKETSPTSALMINFKSKDNDAISNEALVLVVDTNIFIHQLDFIKNVLNSHIKGYSEQPNLLVPWRVINELDRLKDNNNGNGALCKRAKSAMDYLYKSLPENNRIKGQSLRDANSHIYPCELPDDEILNCCLQQAERGKSVILLSNDKNLCNKAVINNIKCIGLSELKKLLESHPQPTLDPDLYAGVKHYENTIYKLLANILENEMRAKYNTLWQHVLFKAPPWKLSDVLECLLKHWIAVFNDVFPRIEHIITDLKNSLASIERKDPQTLTHSEVTCFKELCLEVAKKCQIIPEYLELAKTTVERLSRNCDDDKDSEMVVIDAFEGVWTVFSGYCAKLATSIGVDHSLEDNLPGNDPLEVLTSKLTLFSTQISNLTIALTGALHVDNTDQSVDSHIKRLESAFKESLASLCMDSSAINANNLRIFCTKCRNMLQEACAKFTQLTELLQVCNSTLSN
ncbi:hypothetical protein K1T71_008995 [Dendrolimus kikuchii]|uniref:Uncharacterized protein n=1 Tax=Dendrolimus kikuchii TaxID=765133 RepID=A0ACC1CW67_9NEOP|nr:hypothetical protein K1T71_008995 [Dendrolimus kikuchii]